MSRRGFLAVAPFDFTRASAALEPDAIVDSACQFCNSLCRIKVAKKSGRVIEIRGEPRIRFRPAACAPRRR